jgi:acyl carrier protein
MQLNEFTKKFAEQFIEPDNAIIKQDTQFRQLPTYDSLTGMAILAMIQDDYGIIIPVEDYKKVNTPEELFELTKSKKER